MATPLVGHGDGRYYIVLSRSGALTRIYRDGVEMRNVYALKIETGVGEQTMLTLTLAPAEVEVIADISDWTAVDEIDPAAGMAATLPGVAA